MSRRLPVYLLIDVSSSMRGNPIRCVQQEIRNLVQNMRNDPQTLESAFLSIITFGTVAEQIVPLTSVLDFQLPPIIAGGRTNLGQALDVVCYCAQTEVRHSTKEHKGDWRPMMFLLTDGRPWPEKNIGTSIRRFQSMKWGMAVSCAAGGKCDIRVLNAVTPNRVLVIDGTDYSLLAFFRWMSSSIVQTATKHISSDSFLFSSFSSTGGAQVSSFITNHPHKG